MIVRTIWFIKNDRCTVRKENKYDYHVKGTTRHITSSVGLGGFPIDKKDIPFEWRVFIQEISADNWVSIGMIE